MSTGLADTLQHLPGRHLRNPEIAVEPRAGNALGVGQVQVDGKDPLAERQPGVFQQVSDLDGEVAMADRAPKRHLGV